jgi:hypothetical protein
MDGRSDWSPQGRHFAPWWRGYIRGGASENSPTAEKYQQLVSATVPHLLEGWEEDEAV